MKPKTLFYKLKHLFKFGKGEPKSKKSRAKEDRDSKNKSKKVLPELPDDVMCVIFSFCNIRELLLIACLVCKRWNRIITSGTISRMYQIYCSRKGIHSRPVDTKEESLCECESSITRERIL